jgi:hypothetical protein
MKDALSICADHKQKSLGESWAKGVFCPRPDTEPTKICIAARWYLAQSKSHDTPMVAIDKIEDFQYGFYGFTLDDLLLESYESYKERGNRRSDTMDQQIFKPLEKKKFHMPVCEYEDRNLLTVTKGVPLTRQAWPGLSWAYNWEFPAICGNHAGNETADFLDALNLGPDSYLHTGPANNRCSPDKLNEVFNDLIPRVCSSHPLLETL